jgi:hypothetical protein
MYAKLIALGLATSLVLSVNWFQHDRNAGRVGGGLDLVLVPETLDGLQIKRRWNHSLGVAVDGDVMEDGAVYADADGQRSVMLDFWRNGRSEHNGIECYLIQGESVVREQLVEVMTRSGRAVFNVALLRNGGRIRLAAATQCKTGECVQKPMRLGAAPLRAAELPQLLKARIGFLPTGSRVVPVSLSLEYPAVQTANDLASTERRLFEDFRRVAGQLDLAPAQALAARSEL